MRIFTASHGWTTALPAHNADADERQHALSSALAALAIEDVRSQLGRHDLLALHALATSTKVAFPLELSDDSLLATIERALGDGELLLVSEVGREGAGTTRPGQRRASGPDVQRLVDAAMKGQHVVELRGRRYKLCDARSVAYILEREPFQVVRLEEARGVVARLAERAPEDSELFSAIAKVLSDPQRKQAGVLVLRESPRPRYQATTFDPPVTPSELKALATPPPPKKQDIEIRFLEASSGRPLKDVAFVVTKPDGSESRLSTSAAGSIKLSDLDPGTCVLESVIDEATLMSSFGIFKGGPSAPASASSEQSSSATTSGSATASGSASAGAQGALQGGASALLGLGLNVSVDALAHGDVKGAFQISGGVEAAASVVTQLSASAAASATASAQASASATGSLGASGEALGSGDADPATSSASAPDDSPISSAFVIDLDKHRVAAGDTFDSIGAIVGLSGDAIAEFNFETSDPDALQEFMRERVGCTKTTSDGKEYVFDDDDDPGIILLPRPWSASFAVGQVHEVRVAALRSVYIYLENEDGIALPGASYEARFVDQSERTGTLGSSGIACLEGVPEGPFSVTYPDQDDLLARSLAASTRRAFDEQATGPLFHLLGQRQDIIDRAISVYEEYFNDLTGEGFAADIDQVVTDPEARPPLVFLCKLAGIDIEGTDGVVVQEVSEMEQANG